MNNYRVYLTWSDGDVTVAWVDARSESHACFLAGMKCGNTLGDLTPEDVIVNVSAVLETN